MTREDLVVVVMAKGEDVEIKAGGGEEDQCVSL